MIKKFIIITLVASALSFQLPVKICVASSETSISWLSQYPLFANPSMLQDDIIVPQDKVSYEKVVKNSTLSDMITADYGNPTATLRDSNDLKKLIFSLNINNCNVNIIPSISDNIYCNYNKNYYDISYYNSILDISLKSLEDGLWQMNTDDIITLEIPFKYYKAFYINSNKSSVNLCPMNVEINITSSESSIYICASSGLEYNINYEGYYDTTILRLFEGGPKKYLFSLIHDDGALMYGNSNAYNISKSIISLPKLWNYSNNNNVFKYLQSSINTSENKIVTIDFRIIGTALSVY